MALIDKHRESHHRIEIADVLKQIYLKDSELTLWQKKSDDSRVVIKSKISEIDFKKGYFYFEDIQATNFDYTKPIYFLCDHKSFSFKTYNYLERNGKLYVDFPEEVYLEELRKDPRKSFDISNLPKLTVELRREGNKTTRFEVSCLDVSSNGLAFLISSNNVNMFYEGEELWIVGYDNSGHIMNLKTTIKYIEKFLNSKRSQNYRVGALFSEGHQNSLYKLFN